jgi:Tol biopolymer transport system component
MSKTVTALVLGVALLSGALAAQGAPQQDVELQAAIRTETVDGDLRGAIGQYRKLAESSDRSVAAQALVRMAGVYEKLGDAEAPRIYERVVREYPEQTAAVALARAQLGSTPEGRAASGAWTSAKGDRVVKAGEVITWGDGRVSPDGRLISYVDHMATGNLMLHDLATGVDRSLTGNKDWSVGSAYESTFSPDGKQVAYGWRTFGPPAHINEIRVVSAGGAGLPQPRRIYGSEDVDVFRPVDWSRDGEWLAVQAVRKDRTKQIAIVGVRDGSFLALKTVGWRGPGKIFFSPDGKYLAYDLPPSDTEAQRDVYVIAVDGGHETPVVQDPSHDVVMGWSPDGKALLFASDRSGARTGAVGLWHVPVSDGRPRGAPTLLKADIGSIQSQGLTASGVLHIVKNASTMSLQVAPIDLERGRLAGSPVLQVFRSGPPSWSPDGKQLAYTSRGDNGLPFLAIRSLESGQVRDLHPPLSYMPHPRWLPDARSLVVWGRDVRGRGVIYQVDAQTGRESLVAETEDIQAVQVSPDGKKIYYTSGVWGGTASRRLIEHDLSSGDTREIRLPANWRQPLLSPDGQRFAETVDDAKAKTSTLTTLTLDGGEPRTVFTVSSPDVVGGMAWTADSQAVLVVSATPDEYQPKALWLVPVNGGSARKLDIDVTGWIGYQGIRLHPDGTQIAYFTGPDSREVWALEAALR